MSTAEKVKNKGRKKPVWGKNLTARERFIISRTTKDKKRVKK